MIQPIYPTPEEIAKYQEEMEDSEEEGDSEKKDKEGIKIKGNGEVLEKMGKQNVDIIENGDDDIQVIKVLKANEKAEDKKKVDEDEDYPPFATFKYEVIEIEPWDYKQSKVKYM